MKTMTLYCENGKHEWERPSKRGRPPLNCPDHATVSAKPTADPEKVKEKKSKALEAARAARAQQIAEREAERLAALEKKKEETKARLPEAEKKLDDLMAEERKLFEQVDSMSIKGKTDTTKYKVTYERWQEVGQKVDRALGRLLQLSAAVR